ncbi:MAG: hypothetical protein U1E56_09090 [Bauldia sp.]
MPYLIEILLPATENHGRITGDVRYADAVDTLVRTFGGLTAFTRSPADGWWDGPRGETLDRIVIVEVIAPSLDRQWWQQFRSRLETAFRQQRIVVRAQEIELL